MRKTWVTAIRDQCIEANIPFWFKSWGTDDDYVGEDFEMADGWPRTLDGHEWNELPGGDIDA